MRLFEQQHLLQLDRLREQYKRTRNARAGLLRGALRELGALVPRGLRDNLPGFQRALRERWTPLPAQMRQVYAQVLDEAQRLQVAMDSVETRLAELTRDDPIVQRLLTIRGVGPLIATAIRASVGDIERFPSGRHLACWLGLTARECSSGAYFSSGGHSHEGRLEPSPGHGSKPVLTFRRFDAATTQPTPALQTRRSAPLLPVIPREAGHSSPYPMGSAAVPIWRIYKPLAQEV